MDGGLTEERYRWHDGRLAEVAFHVDSGPADHTRVCVRGHEVIDYDAIGRVRTIRTIEEDGTERVTFQRAAATPSALRRAIAERLTELVPRIALAHAPDEPVFGLVLHYDEEDPLPPTLAFGLESHRDRCQAAGGITSELATWNPAEFPNYDGTGIGGRSLTDFDPQLGRLCDELHARVVADGESYDPRPDTNVLDKVAGALRRQRWWEELNATDDFTVYPVDLELLTLATNLRKAFPRKRLRELEAAGSIPSQAAAER